MPKYRVFFNGTQVDLEASSHRFQGPADQQQLQFLDDKQRELAVFKVASIHGFVQLDAVLSQTSTEGAKA